MSNSYPPNEVDDCESPADRLIDSPKTDAIKKQIRDCQEQQLKDCERDRKANEPSNRRFPLQDNGADLVRNGGKRQLSTNDRVCRVN